MSDIFISYASEDRSRVEPLANALEEQGWSVWWDRTIPPGKTFDQVIEEALNAARCVIVLWSEKSIKSDWVKEEANIGKERKILVPAKIDPVDLPLGFGRIQAADLIDWETQKSHPGFLSLLNAISEIAGPPPERDKRAEVTQLPESNLEQEVKTKDSETVQANASHLKSVEKAPPITSTKAPPRKQLVFGIVAVALILVLGGVVWFLFLNPASYTITASVEGNGSISPTGSVLVSHGDSKRFEITPGSGYRIADVQVDGKSVGAVSRYEFNDITSDHKVSASFAKIGHKITLRHVGAFVAKFYVNWNEKNDKGDLVPKSYASGNKTAGYRHEIVLPGDAQDIRVQAQVKTGLVWDPWHHHYKNYPTLDDDKFLKLSGTTLNSSFTD